MIQEHLFKTIPCNKYDLLSRKDIVTLHQEEEKIRIKFQKENEKLRMQLDSLEVKQLELSEDYIAIKNMVFGKSSEQSGKKRKKKTPPKERGKRTQIPSERYPNATVREVEISFKETPHCSCCNSEMQDSGMFETSEVLTVIPKKFEIIRQKRKKFCCNKCYGDIKTAPVPPRIIPGSGYSNEMILDIALSKFLDLIPIERYTKMAGRENLINLPPNSLIQLTHCLADFFREAARKCKKEVQNSEVVKADETPHRQLERKEGKDTWYLWGFSTDKSCYFEIQKTRSGDIASAFLKDSDCIYLMSDQYSGYQKAVRITNEYRVKTGRPKIIILYCNTHARRYFKRAEDKYPDDVSFFLKMYRRIYRLEGLMKEVNREKQQRLRHLMMEYAFARMEAKIVKIRNSYSTRGKMGKAMRYFYDNYKELTFFTSNPDLPIDNNSQEALLRNPVIGRKTWLGTHSRRGSETTAIHFTLIESCRLNKVNPREYYRDLSAAILQGEDSFTPYEYKVHLSKNIYQ